MIHFRGTVVAGPTVMALSHRMRNLVADGADPIDVVLDHLDRCPDRELPALIVSLLRHTRRSAGQPAKPLTMTEDERRRAHARHAQGDRDEVTVRGEREYQRAHKRTARHVDNSQQGKGSQRLALVESGAQRGPESTVIDRGQADWIGVDQ